MKLKDALHTILREEFHEISQNIQSQKDTALEAIKAKLSSTEKQASETSAD